MAWTSSGSFDALNDIDQLEVGMRAVKEAGGVLEATVCYSGDSECSLALGVPRSENARYTPL